MKNYVLYIGLALLSGIAAISCDDSNIEDANDVLAVKSVLPTKVMEGQIVTITGTGGDRGRLQRLELVMFP